VTQIYKIGSDIWVPSLQEFGSPKSTKFRRDFEQFSGLEQNIVNRKTVGYLVFTCQVPCTHQA